MTTSADKAIAKSGHRRLRAVPLAWNEDPEPRCSVAAQAVMAGPQEVRVNAVAPHVSETRRGHICLRVGRILIYLEDRTALEDWTAALSQANRLAEGAFGPPPPVGRYEPTRH